MNGNLYFAQRIVENSQWLADESGHSCDAVFSIFVQLMAVDYLLVFYCNGAYFKYEY